MGGRGPRKPEHIKKKLEKMRVQYAALTAKQKEAIRTQARNRREIPEVKLALAKTARAWRANRSPEQIEKDRKAQLAYQTAWYRALSPEQRKIYNKKRYVVSLINQSLDWACQRGCGLNTQHPTGLCTMCRMTTCRKCTKPLEQTFLGQRVHERCVPKGDAEFTWS